MQRAGPASRLPKHIQPNEGNDAPRALAEPFSNASEPELCWIQGLPPRADGPAADSLDRSKTTGHIEGMPQRSVREQLVEHAEDVFRQQGFSAASVQDLTVAAGVPKGSFYNHFASKQDLAREILFRYVRATDTSMLADEGLPAKERLRRHFAGQVERTMRTGLEFGCLLGTLSAESPAAGQEVRAGADTGFAQWAGAVAEAIAAGQRSGEI